MRKEGEVMYFGLKNILFFIKHIHIYFLKEIAYLR